MGQKRIKIIGRTTEEEKPRKDKKSKKKVAKVPGLKGGQRVVVMSGEAPPVEAPAAVETEVEKVEGDVFEGELQESRPPKKKGQPGRGGRYQQVLKKVEPKRRYPLSEAIALVKKTNTARFESSVEIHLNLKKRFAPLRGTVVLPHGTGKKTKILVFGEAAEGADLVGDEALLERLAAGDIPDVDVILATPDWMPKLARAAKYLGPRRLMPNPKAGTVTKEPGKKIEEIRGGRIVYGTEPKAPIVHLAVGRVSWDEKKLEENIRALLEAVGFQKIAKATLASTMGPGVRIEIAQ